MVAVLKVLTSWLALSDPSAPSSFSSSLSPFFPSSYSPSSFSSYFSTSPAPTYSANSNLYNSQYRLSHWSLLNQLSELKDDDLEPFIPQICNILLDVDSLSNPDVLNSLERILVQKCALNLPFGLRVQGILKSMVTRSESGLLKGWLKASSSSQSQKREEKLRILLEEIEQVTSKGENLPTEIEKLRKDYYRDYVLIGETLSKLGSDLRDVPVDQRLDQLKSTLSQCNTLLYYRMLTQKSISSLRNSFHELENFYNHHHRQALGVDSMLYTVAGLCPAASCHSLHFPLQYSNDNKIERVLRFVEDESEILQSRDRVPYLVTVEILEQDSPCKSDKLYTEGRKISMSDEDILYARDLYFIRQRSRSLTPSNNNTNSLVRVNQSFRKKLEIQTRRRLNLHSKIVSLNTHNNTSNQNDLLCLNNHSDVNITPINSSSDNKYKLRYISNNDNSKSADINISSQEGESTKNSNNEQMDKESVDLKIENSLEDAISQSSDNYCDDKPSSTINDIRGGKINKVHSNPILSSALKKKRLRQIRNFSQNSNKFESQSNKKEIQKNYIESHPINDESKLNHSTLNNKESDENSFGQNHYRAFVKPKTWEEKKKYIQSISPFGNLEGWNIKSFIVKSGDDLLKEMLASQILKVFHEAFTEFQLDISVYPLQMLPTGYQTGIIEYLKDTESIDRIKKNIQLISKDITTLYGGPVNLDLLTHFKLQYGPPGTPQFNQAVVNFMRSLVGYSLFTYLVQVRDRHNANILMDKDGHIIHIDFGFILGDSPGFNINFENAPFKMTKEYIELLGGIGSPLWKQFEDLFVQGFFALQSKASELYSLIYFFYDDKRKNSAEGLYHRLAHLNTREEILSLLYESISCSRTRQYDWYQQQANNIFM